MTSKSSQRSCLVQNAQVKTWKTNLFFFVLLWSWERKKVLSGITSGKRLNKILLYKISVSYLAEISVFQNLARSLYFVQYACWDFKSISVRDIWQLQQISCNLLNLRKKEWNVSMSVLSSSQKRFLKIKRNLNFFLGGDSLLKTKKKLILEIQNKFVRYLWEWWWGELWLQYEFNMYWRLVMEIKFTFCSTIVKNYNMKCLPPKITVELS